MVSEPHPRSMMTAQTKLTVSNEKIADRPHINSHIAQTLNCQRPPSPWGTFDGSHDLHVSIRRCTSQMSLRMTLSLRAQNSSKLTIAYYRMMVTSAASPMPLISTSENFHEVDTSNRQISGDTASSVYLHVHFKSISLTSPWINTSTPTALPYIAPSPWRMWLVSVFSSSTALTSTRLTTMV